MPGCLGETRAILEWIASTLGRDTYVNLMDQYHPAGNVTNSAYAEINRPVTSEELAESRRIARDLGLRLDVRRTHARLRRLVLEGS
jgi:putative pyruvate formate lyase activating enzyme